MKNYLAFVILSLIFFSCKNNPEEKGSFKINAEIKNIENQKVFLEQLYFNNSQPEVLDTAEIVNGKFTVHAVAPEEGMYRLRLEKQNSGFIFINDAANIDFHADIKDASLTGPSFSSPANKTLTSFLGNLESKGKLLNDETAKLEALKTTKNNDSAVAAETIVSTEMRTSFTNYVLAFADTTTHPVLAMFALGYANDADPALLGKIVGNLATRFPQHQQVGAMITRFNQMKTQQAQASAAQAGKPGIGTSAPDFTMNDVNEKPFSLSQLKGKYVLVDFWASWCAPCRGENPNVVAAYNKYKSKNFTVLGVSLDDKKEAWLKAIKDDNLTWTQISDLKKWNSASVSLFGFNGIPYNLLIDPQGKIIATELRAEALDQKLAEVLK
ncbi:MAG: TlpA disulfide reductase family protein [Ferruginibacter sp.]